MQATTALTLRLFTVAMLFASTSVFAHTIGSAHYDEEDQSLYIPNVSADSLSFFDIVLRISGESSTTLDLVSADNSLEGKNSGNFYNADTRILNVSGILVGSEELAAQFQLNGSTSDYQFDLLGTSPLSSCNDYIAAFEPYTGLVSAYCGPEYLHIDSQTGLPDLSPDEARNKSNVGITSWILRVPIPYHYEWRIPLQPDWTAERVEATPKGPIAVAINGVPIFHYERRPDASTLPENYDPGSDTVLQGELDQCGGHAGQGDDYHYHYAPVCLLDLHDLDQPIAFSLDGAPIIYGTGGTDFYGGGRFNAINNLPSSTLDECNALDNMDGTYSYYTTSDAPYVLGCHRANVDSSLRIEPRPLAGREQGTSNPYGGGSFGEPTETLVTDFYIDESGAYHFEHESFNGSGTSAVVYRLVDAENNCWEFDYRLDAAVSGTITSACRSN